MMMDPGDYLVDDRDVSCITAPCSPRPARKRNQAELFSALDCDWWVRSQLLSRPIE